MNANERKTRLGESIRMLREEQGISQRRFALMLGIGQAYLSLVEKGERNIGFDNLCRIADGLGIEVSKLVSMSEKESDSASVAD